MLSKECNILVSGDKRLTLDEVKQGIELTLLHQRISPKTLVHADRPKTLDRLAATWAFMNRIRIVKFKPNWDSWGISAESKRDNEMCVFSDVCIFFAQFLNESNYIIEFMKKLNKPVYVIGE